MPEIASSSTWIERLSPGRARGVLVAVALVTAALIWVGLGMSEPVKRAGPSDFDTYERVVAAMRAGASYYPALHEALLAGGYGTLSPLNWRTPTYLTFLSWFPSLGAAKTFLSALAAVGWAISVLYARRVGGLAAGIAAGIVMALSLLAIGAPRAELSFELSAGTLILISVCAYGLGLRWLGIAAAVLALFVRELAGVYVLVCLALALYERRWPEVAVWLAAVMGYAGFYFLHAQQVASLIGPADRSTVEWLQLGGPVFLLRAASFNGVLLAAPYWVAGLVLVLGGIGIRQFVRPALTVAAFLLLFLFYGRPVNDYWGGLFAPLIAFGLVFAPGAIGALIRRATRPRSS
jgi:hypothetical protein